MNELVNETAPVAPVPAGTPRKQEDQDGQKAAK